MQTFIEYIYLWHPYAFTVFLIAGVAAGLLLSLAHRHKKRWASTVVWATLIWVLVFYPIYMVGQFNRWQDNITSCQTHGDYIMLRGVCYKPVDGYVPITTWTLDKAFGSEMKK